MATDSILIVDDTPVNLKLVRVLLSRQGFEVRTAETAEEALQVVRDFRPRLVLADIQLPGMDGFEMTRRLKADPLTSDTIVLALTAFAMKGDEQKAFEAGCDGYITKPIDTRTFPALIRRYLNGGANATAGPEPRVPQAVTKSGAPALQELQQEFLATGIRQIGTLIGSLGDDFDNAEALATAHRWSGTAGSVGYSTIGQSARELENVLLKNGPVSPVKTREILVRLSRLFSEALETHARQTEASPKSANGHPPASAELARVLAGKRFALVGFTDAEISLLSAALEAFGAFTRSLANTSAPPDAESLRPYDVVIANAGAEWHAIPDWHRPVLLIGPRETLVKLNQQAQNSSGDFLFSPWTPEEAALRSYLICSRATQTRQASASPAATETRVVIADDDPTIRALVEATVQNSGVECRSATNGGEALELIRKWQPSAAVIDVNMPNLNGFEVLSALREDPLTRGVRVILLTARQQETDVVRGFGLGADDYVIKPFSPMELLARLKRLLGKQP